MILSEMFYITNEFLKGRSLGKAMKAFSENTKLMMLSCQLQCSKTENYPETLKADVGNKLGRIQHDNLDTMSKRFSARVSFPYDKLFLGSKSSSISEVIN